MIDLDGGPADAALTSGYLPDSSDLRLLITSFEYPGPNGVVKHNEVIKTNKHTDIEVRVGNQNHMVVRIAYSIKSGITGVEFEYFYRLGGQKRLFRLRDSKWKDFENQKSSSEAMKKKLGADIAKQKQASTTLTRRLAAAQKQFEEADAFLKFKKAVHNKGKIYFREYIESSGRQIELTNSDVPPKKKDGGR